MKEGLELVMKLKPVRFTWGKEHGGKADFGFIAQELGEVLPEIVVYEPDGKYAKGLDYSKVTPVLTAAVQALKAANDNLTSPTTQLRPELKSANDNHLQDALAIEELRKEMRDLKAGVGFKRAAGQ